jgi:hypothetical protein
MHYPNSVCKMLIPSYFKSFDILALTIKKRTCDLLLVCFATREGLPGSVLTSASKRSLLKSVGGPGEMADAESIASQGGFSSALSPVDRGLGGRGLVLAIAGIAFDVDRAQRDHLAPGQATVGRGPLPIVPADALKTGPGRSPRRARRIGFVKLKETMTAVGRAVLRPYAVFSRPAHERGPTLAGSVPASPDFPLEQVEIPHAQPTV